MANILDFLSDISKESIGFPDIATEKISVDLLNIIHNYTGLLSTFQVKKGQLLATLFRQSLFGKYVLSMH